MEGGGRYMNHSTCELIRSGYFIFGGGGVVFIYPGFSVVDVAGWDSVDADVDGMELFSCIDVFVSMFS